MTTPPPSAAPVLSPMTRPWDFFQGLSLPLSALGLLFRSRRLFLLSALSSLVTCVSLGGLGVLLWRFAPALTGHLWARPEGTLLPLWYVLLAGVFLVLFAVGANTVPLLLLAPLQDPLSEATEALCGGYQAPPFTPSRWALQALTSVAHTLLRITWLLAGHLVLLALNLLPAIGNLAWAVAGPLWTMAWLAAEYLDAPMARHLYRFSDVRRAVWGRLPLSLGFGAALYVLLWIPVLNFFFIPLAVVGGTLLFRGLKDCGGLPELTDRA